MTRIHLTLQSWNEKTGPMPVSTSSSDTCPPSCPWIKKGCYAKHGPLAWWWERINQGQRGSTWAAFLEQIRKLPKGTVWRHNQAGDLPGKGETLDISLLNALVIANQKKRGFTFTHKRLKKKTEKEAVKAANANGFTINLSADTIAEADQQANLDIGPVAVIVSDFDTMPKYTPEGRKLVPCPEQTVGLTCLQCQLCAIPWRKSIIAFEAHSSGKGYIKQFLKEGEEQ